MSYNILIGWKALNALGVVVSMPYMAIKFPAEDWSTVITIKADPKEAKVCYALSLKTVPYVPPTSQEGTNTTRVTVIEQPPSLEPPKGK